MKQIKLPLVLALFLFIAACGLTTNNHIPSEIPNGWKLLDNKHCFIQYPEDWEPDSSGQMGTEFILFSRKSTVQDQFRENVNFMLQDLKGLDIDLKKFADISEMQIHTMVMNGKIIESKLLGRGTTQCYKMIYTGDMGGNNLKFEQFYWVRNGKAWILTLTCEATQFDQYKQIGEKILKSFRLK
jgi:hypothetical protein